jgi:Uma2 family endonuclease
VVVQVLRRRFTVEEYYRMAEAGILHEDDRVELIEGEIVQMAAVSSRHAAGVMRLIMVFPQRVAGRALVNSQNPIRLGQYSEPQPDLVLLRLRSDSYTQSHPGPEDILLVIEVSLTSEEYDCEIKIPLYARHGIRETWLVDLEGDAIEVYQDPGPEGYRQTLRVRRGERLAPEAFPELELLSEDVLGA